MLLDGSLVFSESVPWEDSETEVDDCCIEQIDFAIDLESVFRSIELATVEQRKEEISVQIMWLELVDSGQSCPLILSSTQNDKTAAPEPEDWQ